MFLRSFVTLRLSILLLRGGVFWIDTKRSTFSSRIRLLLLLDFLRSIYTKSRSPTSCEAFLRNLEKHGVPLNTTFDSLQILDAMPLRPPRSETKCLADSDLKRLFSKSAPIHGPIFRESSFVFP